VIVRRRFGAARAARGLFALALGCALAASIVFLPVSARLAFEPIGVLAMGLVGSAIVFGLVPLAIAGLIDSRGRAEWFIAMRYLVAKRRQTFISAITAICIAGVAAGVWLIITVLSVMNGFERTWREEIIGNRAHFTVHHSAGSFADYDAVVEKLLTEPRVQAASPFFDAEGMVRGENGGIAGVRIHGVDPARIASVTDLDADIHIGSLAALGPGDGDEDPGILIGSELAGALGISEGSPLVVISPFGGPPTPFGSAPRLVRFRVVGIFKTSFFQYDEVFTYVDIRAAQRFRRADDVAEGIEVRTTDYYRSAQIARSAVLRLGDSFYTVDWKQYFPAFFQALKTERVMMMILLTMIMVVAAFAIVVTLVMMIMEKSSDIAILKAMGAEDSTVERVFAIEGALIGSLGTLLGLIAGLAVTSRLAWIQRQAEELVGIDALPASVYQGISELPAELDITQIATVIGIAMVLSLGGTWVPSRQAARVDPAEALRYE
jgi:lipoprotein-releasing system permease protein